MRVLHRQERCDHSLYSRLIYALIFDSNAWYSGGNFLARRIMGKMVSAKIGFGIYAALLL